MTTFRYSVGASLLIPMSLLACDGFTRETALSPAMKSLGISVAKVSVTDLFANSHNEPLQSLTLTKRINIDSDGTNSDDIDAIAWESQKGYVGVLSRMGSSLQVFDARSGKTITSAKPSKERVYYVGGLTFLYNTKVLTLHGIQLQEFHYVARLAEWDLVTGKLIRDGLVEHGNADGGSGSRDLNFFAISADKRLIATIIVVRRSEAENNGPPSIYIDIVDVHRRLLVMELNARNVAGSDSGIPTAITLSSDGRVLAIGTNTGRVFTIDTPTGHVLQNIQAGASTCSAIILRPDGKVLAAGFTIQGTDSNSHAISLINTKTGEPLGHLSVPIFTYHGELGRPDIRSLAWGSKNDRLAVGSGDTLLAWDNASNKDRRLVLSKRMPVNAFGLVAYHPYRVAFSTDGKLAVAARDAILVYE